MDDEYQAYYRERKRTLVTGGAGFIGSHVVERLVAQGDDVIVLDNMSTGRRENLAGVDGRVTVHEADLLTIPDNELDRIVNGVDRIFHLASVVGVQLYVSHPVLTINSIMRGTERLLDRLVYRSPNIPFLLTSTSEAYGRSPVMPMHEAGDILFGATDIPRWSYGLAKALDEQLVFGMAKLHGLEVKVVRLFNVVGPRQTGAYGMVMPRFVEQALRGDPVTVYGTGEQTRTFCHVDDIVTGLVKTMDSALTNSRLMNIGGWEEVSINELARRVIEITGSSSKIVHVPYRDAYGDGYEDIPRRVPDINRAQGYIGFNQTMGLDAIIRSIVAWKQADAVVEGANS